MGISIRRSVSGIPILAENLEHLRSVVLGVWVRVGSRHEGPLQEGLAHMVEHMVFKGTRRRSARRIAEVIENVGGELNAFTAREYSCFYVRVAWDKFDLACDVLSDLLQHPTFPEAEFERERQVVLEEIAMYEDQPDDLVHEDLVDCLFDRRLGHPITGSKENVRELSREVLVDWFRKLYHPENMFLTVVGKIPRGGIKNLQQAFDRVRRGPKVQADRLVEVGQRRGLDRVRTRAGEQLHLALGIECPSIRDPDRYALHILSNYLGGGMTSRLFQEVREKRGLAYSVYSFVQSYSDKGVFGIYAATRPDHWTEVLAVSFEEMLRLAERGIRPKELQVLKDRILGAMQLGLEKSGSRMSRLGVGYQYFRKVISYDRVVESVEAVTAEAVQRVARNLFEGGVDSFVAVGPIEEQHFLDGVRPLKRSPSVAPEEEIPLLEATA